MQFLWRYIDDLVGKGLDTLIIAELLLYISASLVPMALPLAILMSSLMTFGNMGEYYELTAIKASGISLQRIMYPVFIVAIVISIGAFYFTNDVMPYTNLKMRTLLWDVTQQRPELQIVEGEFYNGIDNYSIRIGKKNPSNNLLYDLMVYDHTGGKGNTSVILADSGSMVLTSDEKKLILTLYSGYSYNEMSETKRRNRTYPHREDRFKEQQFIIDLTGLSFRRSNETIFKSHHQMMNLSQLKTKMDSSNKEIQKKLYLMKKNATSINYFKLRQRKPVKRKQPSPKRDKILSQHLKNLPAESKSDEKKTSTYKGNKVDIDIDSVLAILTPFEKTRIMSNAKGYANNTRTYVKQNYNTLSHRVEQLRRFEVEYQRKFTISFACILFLLIGAPLGSIIRKGGMGLSLVISVFLFIFYYILSLFGEKMVRENILPDYQGMWLASLIFFITGAFLTYQATTDSSILNLDTYANFFKRLFNISRLTIVEQIMIDKDYMAEAKPKYGKLVSSLESFNQSTDEVIGIVTRNLIITEAIVKALTFQSNYAFLLFERLYRNMMKTFISSEFFHIHQVRSILMLFPGFTHHDYKDSKLMRIISILLFLPPILFISSPNYLTILIIYILALVVIIVIRYYIKMNILRNKLRNIHLLTVELLTYLKFQIEINDE